jgi:hypothetical protein
VPFAQTAEFQKLKDEQEEAQHMLLQQKQNDGLIKVRGYFGIKTPKTPLSYCRETIRRYHTQCVPVIFLHLLFTGRGAGSEARQAGVPARPGEWAPSAVVDLDLY